MAHSVGVGKTGLSPRVRGNPGGPRPPAAQVGSIPAGAGKPTAWCSRTRRSGVYPRGCGETAPPTPGLNEATGLSPRVRGNHDRDGLAADLPGSIPAGAGKPSRPSRMTGWCGVYPRGCGETLGKSYLRSRFQGLSPRVRGNRSSPDAVERRRGSIPAGAGKPVRTAAQGWPRRVYPRGCGETFRAERGPPALAGLSPRVRGNLARHGPPLERPGSIPAGAGKPIGSRRSASFSRVYPRGCGETPYLTRAVAALRGLSPRVRGNH